MRRTVLAVTVLTGAIACADVTTVSPLRPTGLHASNLTVADVTPPTVSVIEPTAGSVCFGGSLCFIRWNATDDDGVASINIHMALDGIDFAITVATGLGGTTHSFYWLVPSSLSTTNGAIRVTAFDPSGNPGSAVVGPISFLPPDVVKPSVTVTSPSAKDKVEAGDALTVTWTSSDNVGVVSHEISYSSDNGSTFSVIAAGIPGSAQNFVVAVPGGKTHDAIILVTARDAAGNAGQGVSGVFKVKKDKS